MGLGHLRAVYPFKNIAKNNIIIEGKSSIYNEKEKKIWRRYKNFYYKLSKINDIPIVGSYLSKILLSFEKIPSLYSKKSLKKSNIQLNFIYNYIKNNKFNDSLIQYISKDDIPVLTSFYATALSIDYHLKKRIFQIICDIDVNRVWVPKDTKNSNIIYLVPDIKTQKRLIKYGVKKDNIVKTGFPLPVLSNNSKDNFKLLEKYLNKRLSKLKNINYKKKLNLLFNFGGSGVQKKIFNKILYKWENTEKKFNLFISIGNNKETYKKVIKYLKKINLFCEVNNSIYIIYKNNILDYYEFYNSHILNMDIIISKPSEMVFYSGYGIPIILTNPIGEHEKSNRRWLLNKGGGLIPPESFNYFHEWINDYLQSNLFHDTALNGFYNIEKNGVINIKNIIKN